MNKNITVVQITDLHLLAERNAKLHGYTTYSMLSDTIDSILSHTVQPDACFVTGDISQDETEASYDLARTELARLGVPVFWIPGNHDDRDMAEAVFGRSQDFRRLTKLATADWDFIYLIPAGVGPMRDTSTIRISTALYPRCGRQPREGSILPS